MFLFSANFLPSLLFVLLYRACLYTSCSSLVPKALCSGYKHYIHERISYRRHHLALIEYKFCLSSSLSLSLAFRTEATPNGLIVCLSVCLPLSLSLSLFEQRQHRMDWFFVCLAVCLSLFLSLSRYTAKLLFLYICVCMILPARGNTFPVSQGMNKAVLHCTVTSSSSSSSSKYPYYLSTLFFFFYCPRYLSTLFLYIPTLPLNYLLLLHIHILLNSLLLLLVHHHHPIHITSKLSSSATYPYLPFNSLLFLLLLLLYIRISSQLSSLFSLIHITSQLSSSSIIHY